MKARLHMRGHGPVAIDGDFVMAIVPDLIESGTMLWLRDGVRIEVTESPSQVAIELGWPPVYVRPDHQDLPLV